MRRFALPAAAKRNPLMPLQRFVPLALALALAGCGSVGAIGLGPMPNKSGQAVETAGGLPPAIPSDQVPPGSARPAGAAPAAPGAAGQGADAVASADPAPAAAGGASAAGGLGRTDLLGGWTIASSGDSCQLFMTLTTWTGGYRASTRGCSNGVLKSISAWNLDGKQVVLAGTGGAPVARLSSSGNNRFDGRTEGSPTPVTFYR
jgi:Protease inhibitor Inh